MIGCRRQEKPAPTLPEETLVYIPRVSVLSRTLGRVVCNSGPGLQKCKYYFLFSVLILVLLPV